MPPKKHKSFKERMEDSPAIFCGTIAVMAFAAGWGAYFAIAQASNQSPRPEPPKVQDAGEVVILKFYSLLNGRRFEDAWNLIHRARKEEVQAVLPDWKAFGKIYDNTVKHENLHIELEHGSPTEATYAVSFDVNDSLPRNTFYEYQDRLTKDLFASGLLNADKRLDIVFNDLSMYYELSEKDRPLLQQTMEGTRVESLFSPLFIAEAARALNLRKLPQYESAPKRNIWRHFILEITLMPEDADWKIRSGLYPAEAVGLYAPGAKVPSQ